MFILRRISGNGIEINQKIGDSYTLITRESNREAFVIAFEQTFGKNKSIDIVDLVEETVCYAFVCGDSITQPLYENQKNFIMTESGKTFCNLTLKP